MRRATSLRRGLAALFAAAVASAFGIACELTPPRPGDACSLEGEMSCFDPQTVLECLGGVRLGIHCGGPKGCRPQGDAVWCDQSLANENDLCIAPRFTRFGDSACSLDRKQMLACPNGRFQLVSTCRGPGGCEHRGGNVACDTALGELGDVCRIEGNPACSVDGQRELKCTQGKLEVSAECRGPDGCKAAAGHIQCDQAVAAVGDACREGAACAVDGKTMLTCGAGKWAVRMACRGPAGCRLEGERIACDSSVAVADDPCDGNGASCSSDGKTLLTCASQRWKVERSCQHGCEVNRKENLVSCH